MKDRNIFKFQSFYFVLLAAVGCFTPYINVYLEKSIGLKGSQIGLITALSLVIGVCVVPIWGIIGDKTKKYNLLLLISIGATIVVLYFYSKQTVYLGCIVCAILLEVARLGSNPMADTITMNYTAKHNGNYGSIRAMGSLGYMLGSMAVGFLATRFGLDGPLFTSYMILSGIALLIAFTFPKEQSTSKEEKVQKGSFKELLFNKHFIFILVITMLSSNVIDASGAYAGNHLVTTLHGNESLISWLTFVQVLPEVLFLAVALRFFKRFGYKNFYLFATCTMIIRVACYAFIPNSYVFVLVGIVHCLGVACQAVGNLAFIKASVEPAVFGTAITLMNAAMSIARAICGYLFGIIYEAQGSFRIFQFSLILVIIAAFLILRTDKFDKIDHKI